MRNRFRQLCYKIIEIDMSYSEYLNIRVSRKFKDELKRIAGSMGTTPSVLARDLMEMAYLLIATRIEFREVVLSAIPTLIERFERYEQVLAEETES